MEVQVETPRPCEAVVSFSVKADEFEAQFERGLRNIAQRTRMKGFRPGKTPISVVKKQYGDQVRHETAQFFFDQALNRAIEDEGLVPAAQPSIGHDDLHAEEGSDFERRFELALRPKLELGDYKGLEATTRPVSVDDEELERTLEDVRRQNARTAPAGEGGLGPGGVAIAKVELSAEGETILDREGLRLAVDHPVLGVDEETWRSAITGKKDGDAFEVAVTFPEDFEKEDVRGKSGVCKVAIQQAFAVDPASDEDLQRLFDAEDMDGVRAKLKERILAAKEDQERNRIESELLERVLDAHPMELPESLVEREARRQVEGGRRDLEAQGVPQEQIDSQLESQYGAAHEATARSMRAVYLMEAIAEKEGLQITRQDLVGELQGIAARNAVPFEEVRDYYQKENLLNQLGLELLERKVRTFLRENARLD